MGEASAAAPAEDDAFTQRAKRAEEIRSEHVYLFQFPPVLPDLTPVHVKPEQDTSATEDASAMDVDPPTTAPATAGPSTVKLEQGAAEPKKSASSTATKPGQASAASSSGCVGKLRIHKSGRAVLDWGGTSLVLSAGADPSFLQNILVAKLPPVPAKAEEGATAEPEVEEAALGMGMGQVRGKFVITPNWDEILS
jgi:DNA-directed RNA polymerase III subunit RPC4